MTPAISFIVPTHDDSHFLTECLHSINKSTSMPHEVLVVDDHTSLPSAISAINQLDSWGPNQQIKILRSECVGLSGARNLGLEYSKGAKIRFVDADDLVMPDSTDALVRLMDASLESNVGAVAGNSWCVNFPEGSLQGEILVPSDLEGKSARNFIEEWERGLSIPIHSALFCRELFGSDRDWFDTELKSKEDFVFWARLAESELRIKALDINTAVYRIRRDSLSRVNMNVNGLSYLRGCQKILQLFPYLVDPGLILGIWNYVCSIYGSYFEPSDWRNAEGMIYFMLEGASQNDCQIPSSVLIDQSGEDHG